MRLLLLPRYGTKGANSRYRLWQYVPLLKASGHHVEVRPMLADDYLESLYAHGKRPLWPTIVGYFRGITRIVGARPFDSILLDQELAPYLPEFFERLLTKVNSSLIVDYDDAAYCKYSRFPVLRKKIGAIMAMSRVVVVGNHHLAEYACPFADDVRLIPTVVDLQRYSFNSERRSKGIVRVCWIGTPITAARFLRPMLPMFLDLQRRMDNVQFRFIGAGNCSDFRELRVEPVEWSEYTEADKIAECDIGIMPLKDDEFERGKCGLKLVQYMAAGLPVIASPVGENRYMVDHGVNGFLAADPKQWFEATVRLASDPELRKQMGRSGRDKVERQYSLSYGFHLWEQLLEDVSIGRSRQLSGFTVSV